MFCFGFFSIDQANQVCLFFKYIYIYIYINIAIVKYAVNSVSLPAIISGVTCAVLVGLVGGVAATAAVMYVCIKWRRSRKETGPSPRQTPPPSPLYEDIELETTSREQEPPVQHNVAYEHTSRR